MEEFRLEALGEIYLMLINILISKESPWEIRDRKKMLFVSASSPPSSRPVHEFVGYLGAGGVSSHCFFSFDQRTREMLCPKLTS